MNKWNEALFDALFIAPSKNELTVIQATRVKSKKEECNLKYLVPAVLEFGVRKIAFKYVCAGVNFKLPKMPTASQIIGRDNLFAAMCVENTTMTDLQMNAYITFEKVLFIENNVSTD